MAFWKFIGSQAEYFPAIGLTAQPGYVYDLGIYPPPDDPRAADGALQPSPANKWQSDPGPATDGAVRQVTDLTAYGFSGGGGGSITKEAVIATGIAASDIGADPAGAAAALTALHKAALVVDATGAAPVLREGTAGPVYKFSGYNAHFVKNIYADAKTLRTRAQRDKYFGQLRPNSTTRFRAYAPPSGSGISWATQLADIADVRDSAKAHGQRLIACLTTWSSIDAAADAYAGKDATWFTSSTYKHSVSGSTSYEDWAIAVASLFTEDGTCWGIDLLNEPHDSGTNAASIASFVTYMSGVVKGVAPDMLVYMGIDLSSVVGGSTPYQTINAGADLCSWHYYDDNSAPSPAQGNLIAARALGKPLICDEIGAFSKAFYGSSGDSDLDDNSWPAVSSSAQGRMIERIYLSMLGTPGVAGCLVYSYMDSDGGGMTDGLGHYEPVNGSLARKVVREVDLNGDEFSDLTLSMSAWLDGAQMFKFAPGAPCTVFTNRTNNLSQNPTSTVGPLSARWGKHAGWQFAAGRFINVGNTAWRTGGNVTHWFAFVPTSLPASSTFGYLVAPQSATGGFAARLNSSGTVEVLKYAAATTGTICATSSNTVNLNDVNLIAITWNTTSGAIAITLNGVRTTATSVQTLSVTNVKVGSADDGTNTLPGILLEGWYQALVETDSNIIDGMAYLTRRYQPVTN